MEFLIPADLVDGASTADVARLDVTAHVLTEQGGVELHDIVIPVTLSPTEGGKAEPEVRREILLLEAARVRQEALEARDRGDHAGAADSLRRYGYRVEESGLRDTDVIEEARDLEGLAMSFDEDEVSAADIKYMKQRAYVRGLSRGGQVERFRRGE